MTPGVYSRISQVAFLLLGSLILSGSSVLSAQISITGVDIPFSQNFNTLATSGTSSTVPAGWAFLEAGGNTLYTANNGGSNISDTYSYGTGTQSDRAFGELTDPVTVDIGASFTNNTGVTITSILIQFVAEQWRLGATGREDRMDFQYSTNATSLNTGTWTDVNPLDLIAPVQSGSAGSALNGNVAANRTLKGGIISGLTITNGSTFWIRWRSFNAAGADDGIAIDDFVLTANPATHYTVTTAAGVVTITDADGNSENLTISETGSSIRFYAPGRTYSLNMGAQTSMPFDAAIAGLILVTVNSGTGNDTMTLGAFATNMPSITCNGGIGNDRVHITGDITFTSNRNLDLDLQDDTGSPGLDHIEFDLGANLTFSGTGFIDMKVSQYVYLENTSSAITSNGAITVEANWQTTPSSGNFKGLEMIGATLQATGSGTVSVKARGGNSGTAQTGILLNGSDIRAGSSGTMTVEGVGGELNASVNTGIWIAFTSEITTSGADINIKGTGATLGLSNRGILMHEDALIQAGGNGDILMEGTAGGSGTECTGVEIEGGILATNNGNIVITGVGAGTTTSNAGINCSVPVITAGGTGSITFNGTGGNGNSIGNSGVEFSATSDVSTSNGDITFVGIGGGVSGAGFSNGVTVINGAMVHAGGSGVLSMTGTGGNGTGNSNSGISIGNGPAISTAGGNILLTGNGGGSGTGTSNTGISIGIDCLIQPAGTGFVLAQGTGGNSTGGNNHGIQIIGATTFISTSGGPVTLIGQGGSNGTNANGVYIFLANISPGTGGDLTITGTGAQNANSGNRGVQLANSANVTVDEAIMTITGVGGMGANSEGILLLTQSNVTTTGGFSEINLIANSMSISAEVRNEIPNPDVRVRIHPYTNGVDINLGSLTDPNGGPLQLSDAELDSITTSELIIGHATTGDIVVLDTITRASNTKMTMTSESDIQITGGYLDLNGGSLVLNPGLAPAVFSAVHTGNDVFCNTMSINGTLEITVNGVIPESQYTQLNVTGVVSLSSASLSIVGSYDPQPGDQFTIIVNDGADAIAGTFSGLAEGAVIPSFLGGNLPAVISYIGGTGNDVVITVSSPNYIITTTGNTLVATDVSGNSDVMVLLENAGSIRFNTGAVRSYSLNGGALSNLPVDIPIAGLNGIEINAEEGQDNIFLNPFTTILPSLRINGGIDNDSIVILGDITLATNAHLDLHLQDDHATPGVDRITFASNANINLSGTGTADLRVSKRIIMNSGSSVITTNGLLTMEANQQATSTTGSFPGISMASNSLIQATGTGLVSVKGKGGTSGGNQNGIVITGGDIIGGSVGVTIVTGTGGSSTGVTNTGVSLSAATGSITTTGSSLIVTGVGGGTGASINNIGVSVATGGVLMAGGAGFTQVNGTGGTTSSNNNDGIRVSGAGAMISSSGGNVLLSGTGGGSAPSSVSCHGVQITSGGLVSAGGNGELTINGLGGPGGNTTHGIVINGATVNTSGSGVMSITGQGGGSGSASTCRGISIVQATLGGIISGGPGAPVFIEGTGGPGTGSLNVGIFMSGALSEINSNSLVFIEGSGGSGCSNSGNGVMIDDGTIEGLDSAWVSITGTGSPSTGNNHIGVIIDGDVITEDEAITVEGQGGNGEGSGNFGIEMTSGSIVSSGNEIAITGQGGGAGTASSNGVGIHLTGSTIQSGVLHDISITGHGTTAPGSGQYGIRLSSTFISTIAGQINITGEGGGHGAASNNCLGLQIESGTNISNAANGNVVIQASSGPGQGSGNIGFAIIGSNIETVNGDINITSISNATGSGGSNYGAQITGGAIIECTGTGNIQITSTGGATSGDVNYGLILLNTPTKIAASDGNIIIEANGGGSGGSGQNIGYYQFDGTVEITGDGILSIEGNGGPGTGILNHGLYVGLGASPKLASGGSILLTGDEGGGSTGLGICLFNPTATTTAPLGDHVVLRTDYLFVSSGVSTTNQDTTYILPLTPGTEIKMGTVTEQPGGPLGVSDTELDSIFTGHLVIGSPATDTIVVVNDITRTDTTDVLLTTGGDIVFASGLINTNGGNLVLDPGPIPAALKPVKDSVDVIAETTSIFGRLEIRITGVIADSLHDQLNVIGKIDLSNASLFLSGSYTPAFGDTFVIVKNDGVDPVISTFLTLPEGAAISNFLGSGMEAVITYVGGDGNDVVMYIQVPDYAITDIGGHLKITDLKDASDPMTLSQNGGNIRINVPGKSFSYNAGTITSLPADIPLAGLDSITINLQGGDDLLTCNAFSSLLPTLDVNGGTGNETITIAGDLNFISNADLIMDLQDDDVAPGNDNIELLVNTDISMAGTGQLVMKVSRGISLTSATIDAVDGNITMESNMQTMPSTASFHGIRLSSNCLIQITGNGKLTMKGRAGNNSIAGYGIYLDNNCDIIGGAVDTTCLDGFGTGISNETAFGVYINQLSSVSSNGSHVRLTGVGGGTGTSFNSCGIQLNNSSSVTAGSTGDLLITGTGGNGSGNNNEGVKLLANSSISSNSGDIFIIGFGGISATGGSSYGVHLTTGSDIIAGGNGSTTIIGTAGGGTGSSNSGVQVGTLGSTISSTNGDVFVQGFGGGAGGTSNGNAGVSVVSNGVLSAGGNGNLTVEGTGGAGGNGFNYGVVVFQNTSAISTNNGSIEVLGYGGSMGQANYGVYVLSSAKIRAGGSGSVIVEGHGGDVNSATNHGVFVSTTNANISAENGLVTVIGYGGDCGSFGNSNGVFLSASGKILAENSGNVHVNGIGGLTTSGSQIGVMVSGTGSSIYTINGDLEVTGSSTAVQGSHNAGIVVTSAGSIVAGGTGTTTVQGIGGASTGLSNYGVQVNNNFSIISSNAGQVHVTGTGGGTGSSSNNFGVYISNGGTITAGDTSDVFVHGTSGSGSFSNYGVLVQSTGSRITSFGGDVSVTGTCSPNSGNTSNGVSIQSAGRIDAQGNGNVIVHGTGSSHSSDNHVGISINNSNSVITSENGNVFVIGIGGGSGANSDQNVGLLVGNNATLSSGGSGDLRLEGTGGLGMGVNNYGVSLTGTDYSVTTEGGDIHVLSREGAGTSGLGLVTTSSGSVSTFVDGGNITLQSNSMSIGALIQTQQTDSVTFMALDTNVNFLVGQSIDIIGGPLRISDTEFDWVSCGTLILGESTRDTVSVVGDVTRSASTDVILRSKKDIIFSTGNIQTGGGDFISEPGLPAFATRPQTPGWDLVVDTAYFKNDLFFRINGPTVNTQYDQLEVIGSVNLFGVDLEYGGAYTPMPGDSFVLINNNLAESIISIFNGLPEGDTIPDFMGSGLDATITYIGGDGNDVVIRMAPPCEGPDVPMLMVTQDTICDGENVTISIVDGDLNEATQWHWYTTTCGGMPVDTGLSIDVLPSATTTYFVRGEGGCVNPGPCAQSTIVVNSYPDATISRTFSSACYYTDNLFQPQAPVIPGATYSWNFGAAASPPTATGYGPHTIQYTLPGPKNVKLVIHPNAPGADCPDSTTLSFNISNCPGQIQGRVIATNGTPISSVNVRLFKDINLDGIPDSDTAVASVFTPANGNFGIASLTPGHYVLKQIQPIGWNSFDDGDTSPDNDVVPNIDSLDNLIPLTLTALELDSINFFIETPVPGSISGNVFEDFNLDQDPDPGEGLAGVSVALCMDMNANGIADNVPALDTVITDAFGLFVFSPVPVGHYVIVELDPLSWTNVKDFDATNDGDLVPNTNMVNDTIPVSLSNSENDANNYFIDITGCSKIVSNTFDDGPGSLREAIDCALSGDTITFNPILSGDTIVINSDVLMIDKDLVILSTLSPTVTVLSQINGLIGIEANAVVECRDLNFISGLSSGNTGAAFSNLGMLTLHHVTITRNPFFTAGEYLILNQDPGEIYISGSCFIQWE